MNTYKRKEHKPREGPLKEGVLRFYPDESNPGMIGYVDIRIPNAITLLEARIYKAPQNKWGYIIKPPYLRQRGKSIPAYSLEGDLYNTMLSLIVEYFRKHPLEVSFTAQHKEES